MVKLHSSSMFVKDPVDVWGKEHTIGNAELAARLGSAMIFDRRGNILMHDDVESSTRKYAGVYSTGTVTRSIDYALTGDFSYKAVTVATADAGSGPEYIVSDFHSDSKFGIQTSFATADDNWEIGMYLTYYARAKNCVWTVRLKSDGTLRYRDSAGVMQDVPGSDSKYEKSLYNFMTIKFVFDPVDGKYVRAIVGDTEYDLSSYDGQVSTTAVKEPYLYFGHVVITTENVAKTVYFNNSILTENEPV